MNQILVLILSLFTFEALACSMMPTSKYFDITGKDTIEPVTPVFELDGVHRGTDDGNHGSCSDAGSIILKLKNIPNIEQGYIFEIVEGTFEDTLFTDKAITLADFLEEKDKYFFVWFDGNSEEQEAFDIRIKITAVSESGIKSEPQYLNVSHPGVQKPWWKVW
ncbi:hypothetical protein A9267_20780 [Shewanella sp. UCD-FRSSP16_17]|uniref:hypothetical protein n=1 Tax=Shewanella sp. UCD-FRSSP16_17 TaxID=1853256 RepID=UPI0007EEE637|nr:hypothetical protein [Shewanella sp. UCD-FRSSP16_17]OBT09585.1 hypothetical protein A9267_20780 [Shewanella sp. UCD-FRSSP16_17]